MAISLANKRSAEIDTNQMCGACGDAMDEMPIL
jgi:hypothetical protein